MLDLAALPIAFALTLWDAIPIFLSIGVALSLVLRVLLNDARFARFWRRRTLIGLEGAVYSMLFYPVLLPPVIAASAVILLTENALSSPSTDAPRRPGGVLRVRAEELVVSVVITGAAASIVKVFSPELSSSTLLPVAVALAAGALSGFRSGAFTIPAIAIGVHLGGSLYAVICVIAAVCRTMWDIRAAGRSRLSITQETS